MKLINTKIEGLKLIKSKIFYDKRGYLRETFRKDILKNQDFPFDVMSFSKKKVLRGLHIQIKNSQAKIITVTHGKIFDVVVDLRKRSKTYGKSFSVILSEKNAKSIFIPPGFAHGFCTLSKENYIVYSCTKYRDAKHETGIRFDDKDLKIRWPIKNPIISKKDINNLGFKEFKRKFM